MTKTTQITDSGPILALLPEAPDVAIRLALLKSLQGHTTSSTFLPQGLWPELDDARAEQLRLRAQAIAILEERNVLLARHSNEDEAHAEALRQAARAGARVPEDARTAPEQRARELTAIDERLWATILVFGELADEIIALVRNSRPGCASRSAPATSRT